ncbi:hypothetical protein HanIR_Chr11g0548231 [Helianthus annuus]|nr:hypothetical protein HanIR_Chr11g0548231 [Helianthus annuus]
MVPSGYCTENTRTSTTSYKLNQITILNQKESNSVYDYTDYKQQIKRRSSTEETAQIHEQQRP